ncbi:MAG TPA: hypothetical protein VFA85_14505 [Terriglobales bacterium]|nr:hypothetical protein [Terriglobales bacterium]
MTYCLLPRRSGCDHGFNVKLVRVEKKSDQRHLVIGFVADVADDNHARLAGKKPQAAKDGVASTFSAEQCKITAVSLTLVRVDDRVNFDGESSSRAVKETRVER